MNLIPIPKHESDAAVQAEVEMVDLGFPKESIIEAAKEHGLTTFYPDRLTKTYTMGKVIKKVGVLKIGRVWLAKAGEAASVGIDQCEDALGTIEDPESRAAILPTKLGFAKELREVATAFIKSAELDGNDDSDNKGKIKPFASGAPAGPMIAVQQAVVTVNQSPNQ